MAGNERLDGGSTRTNAIITALATVLAAVITTSGAIIAATCHAKNVLQRAQDQLETDIANKNTATQALQSQVAQLQQQLKRGSPPPVATGAQEEDGFVFSVPDCKRSAMVVTCRFTITNNGTTRRIRPHARPDLFHNSRALTDQGPLIHADGAVLAGIVGPLPELDVPSRVTIPAAVKFRDVPPEVKTLAVLTIGFEIDITDHEVEFRDIPLR